MKNKNFKKVCSQCGNVQYYSRKDSFKDALINNRKCIRCCQIGHVVSETTKEKIKNSMNGRRLSIEVCNKISMSLKGRKNDWGNKISKSLIGRKLSQEHIEKIRKYKKGKPYPTKLKVKNSIAMKGKAPWIKGKHHTEETKYKIRTGVIKKAKERKIFPYKKSYNPQACKFIDNLNKKFGWNLQHAMNGGEIELYGYFVDGYDKEKNIIFEYDESNHNRPCRINKDFIRQKNLTEKINPFLFLRYNEQWNRLYNCKTDEEIKL